MAIGDFRKEKFKKFTCLLDPEKEKSTLLLLIEICRKCLIRICSCKKTLGRPFLDKMKLQLSWNYENRIGR